MARIKYFDAVEQEWKLADIAREIEANAMVEHKLTYTGTVIQLNGVTQTFAQVKAACDDAKKFVFLVYENRLYIPQYMYTDRIYFTCTYPTETSGVMTRRIAVMSNNTVTINNTELQPKLTPGENISIVGNVISATGGDNVFNVEYGVTTFAEVSAANGAGKICRMQDDRYVYYLYAIDDIGKNAVFFARNIGNNILESILTSSGWTWRGVEVPIQKQSISDTGNYFATDTVEGALQEIGAELNNLPDIPETENAQEIAVDSEVTSGSDNLITSGAVAAAISAAITDIDTLIGSGVIA